MLLELSFLIRRDFSNNLILLCYFIDGKLRSEEVRGSPQFDDQSRIRILLSQLRLRIFHTPPDLLPFSPTHPVVAFLFLKVVACC